MKKELEKNESKKCVIWTRVSTKYQENNGGSLEYQRSYCEEYAKSHGFLVAGDYGGTHESAKTPGKLIQKMMSRLDRDKGIKYVIVSQVDRFSRNAGQGITMFSDLLGIGVAIVEATSNLCSANPNDLLALQFKLCMAQWDNANRTDKFVRGRKFCLEKGVYCGKVPLGYDKEGKSLNRRFTINEDGRLIRKAFDWKLQGVANCQIIERLRPYGLNLSKQKLHKILTNPFYAGKIQHKMLSGEIVDGIQPPIVSYTEFLRVQAILSDRTGVYQHQKETPRFPLKRYVRCDDDHTPFTGYTVKKKNIDYYKCNEKGCKTNVSARKMHDRYEALLDTYDIPQPFVSDMREILTKALTANEGERMQQVALLRKQKSEKENKLKACKVRFGKGEIDDEIYSMTVEALQSEIGEIVLELEKYNKDLSNLETRVNDALIMCCHLGRTWREADLEAAQKLQNLLYPNGIFWNKQIDNYRTIGENTALATMRKISTIYKNKNEKNSLENFSSVNLCG